MTNADLDRKINAHLKVHEEDRKVDQEWKQEIKLILQRITETVFDGNGEMSMVKVLATINTRHEREDERTRIYKTVKRGAMAGLVFVGAFVYHLLTLILDWLVK